MNIAIETANPAIGSQDSTRGACSYPRELRAIGCALEALQVEAFELSSDGLNYLVQAKAPAKKPQSKGLFRRILTSDEHVERCWADLELTYTPEDIEWLDLDGRLKRAEGRKPDPHSLPQALRAIGAYVQLKGGRMVRIAKDGEFFTIQYETVLDRCVSTEEFTPSSLYDVFVRMYVKRNGRVLDVPTSNRRNFR